MTIFQRKGRAEIFGALVVIGAAVLIGWQSLEHVREARANMVTLLQQLARTGEAQIAGSLRNVDTLLRDVAREFPFGVLSEEDNLQVVRTLAMAFPEVRHVIVTDAAGVIRFGTVPEVRGFDASRRPYFLAARGDRGAGTMFVTGPTRAVTGSMLFFASRSFSRVDGSFGGAVVASLSPSFFDGVLQSILPQGHSSSAVVSLAGDVLSRAPATGQPLGEAAGAGTVFKRHLAASVPMTVQRFRSAFDGADRMAVFRTFASYPLVIGVTMDYQDLVDAVRPTLLIYAGLFLLIVVVTVSAVIADRRIRQAEAHRLRRAEASRNFFDHLLETANTIIVGLDDDGRVVLCNSMAEQVIGYKRGDILGRKWSDTVVPRHLYPEAWESFEAHRLAEVPGPFEAPIRRHPDGERWVSWSHNRITDPDDRPLSIWFGIDVTRRRQVQAELEAANVRLRQSVDELESRNRESTILRGMTDGLQTCHAPEEAFVVAAGCIQKLFPGRPGGLYMLPEGRADMDLLASWPEAVAMAPTLEARTCGAAAGKAAHRWDGNHPDAGCPQFGAAYAGSGLCVPILAQGDHQGILVLRDAIDVASPAACQPARQEREDLLLAQTVCEHLGLAVSTLRLRQHLVEQAMRDPLTGLYNRRIMAEMFARELTVAKRKGRPLSVAMVDIDHFKLFNDRHGHEAGDAVLRDVADFLVTESRSSDVVCRHGGEEFVILLPEANGDSAVQWTSRLREGVKKLVTINRGVSLEPVTISIGIAVYPDHGRDAAALLHAADQALYQSKISGRDRVTMAGQGTRDLFGTLAWNDRVAPASGQD